MKFCRILIFGLGIFLSLGPVAAAASAGGVGAIVSWSPAEPRWGDTLVVTYDPGAPKAAFALGDEVFLAFYLKPRHGIRTFRLEREGSFYVGRVAVEKGASFLKGFIVCRHRHDRNADLGVMVFRPDGTPAPGAWHEKLISDFSPETYLACFEKERALYPENFSVYRDKWTFDGLVKRAEFPAILEKDLAEIEKSRTQKESPGLLLALALGNWRAGREEAGRRWLRRLVETAPDDFLAAQAVSDYFYQAKSQQWTGEGQAEVRKAGLKLVEQDPGAPGSRMLIVVSEIGGNLSLKTARDVYRTWISAEPDNPQPYFFLAEAEMSKGGDLVAAEAAALRSAELALAGYHWLYGDVGDLWIKMRLPLTYSFLAQARRGLGRYADALADIRAAKGLTKETRPDFAAIEASIWADLGAADQAEACWLEARAQGHPGAELEIRAIYEKRHGSPEGFAEYLEKKLKGPTTPPMPGAPRVAGPGPAGGRKPAPDMVLKTLDGREVSLAGLKGKVVVLNFWFVNCAPCRAEMPGLNKLVDAHRGQGVVFLGVATDRADAIRDFLKKFPFKYEIVPEGTATANAFGVSVYPTHVLIDKAGNISHFLVGGDAGRLEQLAALIAALAKEPYGGAGREGLREEPHR
jgi:peroxiredoxin/tetratricopeptide (TPR) repeat protein